ncbi:RNA binding protein, putative [Ichthyophthirius multifiliis]|uniref:RNA binding protein, putative n=1 Tax=Ichthyophthirius multifiliis TaxID=5932 RepID=G0QZZ5_ICHMU|nr:RNA binding protein, putative [Ichthyophthirius multifiliis]EGR29205.1 RNA binding protein, putative [Ichthyophthirius multifiliis]|eukprot:XP_004030441.1 RNA binding protein, putative [Ichthyophthirius multifiliis]
MISESDLKTLWIGDIEPWMNEKYLEDVFNKVGRVVSIKLIRNKDNGLPSVQQPQQPLSYMNQFMPPIIQPSIMTTPQMPVSEFSVYVGELELGINEQQLAEHFRVKYPSVIGSKIIIDPQTKMSRGFGFVKFSNPQEGLKAIQEMNGSLFRGKYIKVSNAVNRQQQQQMASSAPEMYNVQQQSYMFVIIIKYARIY